MILLLLLLGGASLAHAQTAPNVSTAAAVSPPGQIHGDFLYPRPRYYTFIQRAPGDIKDDWAETIDKRNRLALLLAVGATAALIPFDQHLVDQAQLLGRRWHIHPTTHQDQKFGLLYPFDNGSALYFIGDGEFHIILTGGFLAYGAAAGDDRALATSSEIIESYITSGLVVRVLKYATGRESPYVETRSGGRWVPFPSPMEAIHSGNKYDAMPSGHLTSAMAVFTVIKENYADDYPWIPPVGYAMLGGLCFQMMNNGVHWASDYPLALFVGYTFGHIAVRKGRTDIRAADDGSWSLTPLALGRGVGLGLSRRF